MKNLIKLLETKPQQELTKSVLGMVKIKVINKNLFGWREYLDDVYVETVSHMIQTKFQYSAGAYIACGVQRAIDHARYCSAAKRRGDYENRISLDQLHKLPEEAAVPSLFDPYIKRGKCDDLYDAICATFGEELATQLKAFIYDKEDKLNKDVIRKCKTEEFREFLMHI